MSDIRCWQKPALRDWYIDDSKHNYKCSVLCGVIVVMELAVLTGLSKWSIEQVEDEAEAEVY
jgi:hypothetical protein